MSGPKTPEAFDAMAADVVGLFTHRTSVRCDRRRYPRCPGHYEGESQDCHGQRVPYCVPCSYRWAWNAAHHRTVGEPGPTSAGSHSDPVAALATELRPDEPHTETERPGPKAVLRKALANACSDVQLAQGLVDRLTKVLERSDTGHGSAVKHSDNTQEISDEARDEAIAARRRREERMEGHGAA